MTRLTTRVDRLTGRTAAPATPSCETCRGWMPQVFVRDDQSPRDEECPACGRRVPIRLIRAYHLVDPGHGEAGMTSAAASGKLVPITRE